MSVLLLCLIQPLQNGVARGALGWSGQDRVGQGSLKCSCRCMCVIKPPAGVIKSQFPSVTFKN